MVFWLDRKQKPEKMSSKEDDKKEERSWRFSLSTKQRDKNPLFC